MSGAVQGQRTHILPRELTGHEGDGPPRELCDRGLSRRLLISSGEKLLSQQGEQGRLAAVGDACLSKRRSEPLLQQPRYGGSWRKCGHNKATGTYGRCPGEGWPQGVLPLPGPPEQAEGKFQHMRTRHVAESYLLLPTELLRAFLQNALFILHLPRNRAQE